MFWKYEILQRTRYVLAVLSPFFLLALSPSPQEAPMLGFTSEAVQLPNGREIAQ